MLRNANLVRESFPGLCRFLIRMWIGMCEKTFGRETAATTKGFVMEFIHAPKACASVGPYSHCVKAGSTYYLCGQVPFHPVTGEVVGNGMKEQAVQTLANMKAVLEAAGLAVTDIAKTTVFVTNMDDFAAFNEVYAAFMGEHRPARVCVEVSNIAHGCLLEMDAICFKE